MKKTLSAIIIVLSLTLLIGNVGTASAVMLNPAHFPFSFSGHSDLEYQGSNTGTPDGIPCALEATNDNSIPVWFQAGGFLPSAIRPSEIVPYCISIYPNDPSEVVNTSTYLSSSQKNYIDVRIDEGYCEFFRFFEAGIKPAGDGFFWSDHVPGLTTGTANPMVGISMIKLQDAAISNSAGEDYSTVADALSAAGFMLDKKGFWVNQCYGQPMILN